MDTAHIDADLATLVAHKDQWASLPLEDKLVYLEHIRDATASIARAWVEAAVKAAGIETEDAS